MLNPETGANAFPLQDSSDTSSWAGFGCKKLFASQLDGGRNELDPPRIMGLHSLDPNPNSRDWLKLALTALTAANPGIRCLLFGD